MILELKMGVKYVVTALKAEKWMPGLLNSVGGSFREPPARVFRQRDRREQAWFASRCVKQEGLHSK